MSRRATCRATFWQTSFGKLNQALLLFETKWLAESRQNCKCFKSSLALYFEEYRRDLPRINHISRLKMSIPSVHVKPSRAGCRCTSQLSRKANLCHMLVRDQISQPGRCLSHLPCLPGIFCYRAFPPGLIDCRLFGRKMEIEYATYNAAIAILRNEQEGTRYRIIIHKILCVYQWDTTRKKDIS